LGENLIVLLPKPDGGERAITITNVFYSIWSRARRAYRVGFDAAQAAFGDTAIAGLGGGALRAAVRRRLATEVAAECDSTSFELLLDVEAVYDSLDMGRMATELLRLGFDARCLRLVVEQYCMPRRVGVGRCLALPSLPPRSALAGCGWANTMAKGYTFAILEI
jgi:hypothetical protein